MSRLELQREDESRLIILMIILSVFIHAGVLLISRLELMEPLNIKSDEWEIAVDLTSDALSSTSLPDAQKDIEAAVSKKMLPQLPKTFELKEKKVAAEGVEEKKAKSKKIEGSNLKDEKGVVTPKKDIDVARKLKLKELKKRLILERLRKEKKLADKKKAPRKDPLAEIGKNLNSKTAKSSLAKAAAAKYGIHLKKKINRNYSLPQTFSSTVPNPVVVLAIVVSPEGHLQSVKVHRSSDDQVFDEYTVAAAENAAPFERPPTTLVGKTILLNFTR